MTVEMLKGKIHRATVVQAELHYVGSITVDQALLEAAGILEYEKVQIVDIDNGSRFETYTIAGERGSGMICPVRQRGGQNHHHVLCPHDAGRDCPGIPPQCGFCGRREPGGPGNSL